MTLLAEAPGSTSCRPRFATPRDERFPTLGGEVGKVARLLGRPLLPWQQELADVAYEFDPVSGELRYDEIDVTVPRQSGKTTLTLAKTVHRLVVIAKREGPQRSTYTAQTRTVARKKLERDFAELLRESRGFVEVEHARVQPKDPTEWRLSLNNGQEHIRFGRSNYLQIDAPSRTGGHGDTLDDGTIDEAFKHEDDTVEAGMRPSMATRRNAQLWVISTAGDARSRYLYQKVLAGRQAFEAGRHGRTCYAEYSAEDDADPGDPVTWRGCMPGMALLPSGRPLVTEQFIAGEWERAQRKGPDGVRTFRRAYLNQWPEVPVLDPAQAPSALDAGRWKNAADARAERGAPVFAVAAAPDRSWCAIGVAWRRPDRGVQVMVSAGDYRPGTAWVADRVEDLRRRWGARIVTDTTVKGLLLDSVTPPEHEQAAAENGLADLLDSGRLWHGNQGELNTAVRGSQWKTAGRTRRLEPKGDADISPLRAVALAAWHVGRDDGGVQFF
jgi:hypothetical protein